MGEKRTTSPIQQVVLATLLVGVALAFIFIGKRPGWQAYVISGIMALGFLLTTLAMWRRSNWVGMLALVALLLAMFWEPGRPVNAIAGAVLAALSMLMTYSRNRLPIDDSEESSGETSGPPAS